MEKVRRFTIRRVLLAVIVSVIFYFMLLCSFYGREFSKTSDAFSGAVSRGDQLAARDYLQNLQYFYELNKKLKPLKLDGIINERFFKEAQHYQSAYDYLTGSGRCEKILKDLDNDDSYWGRFMRANCNFRLAQAIFEGSLEKSKDEKTKAAEQKKAIEMAVATKDDYCEAVKIDPHSTLPPKWNCDIVTNPKAMARTLAPKPIKVRVRLGEGGDKGNNPGNRDGNAPGKGTLDLDKKGGDKPSQNPNPGAQRDG